MICDNASTDETEELCRGFASDDSRIVYHRHPVNVGLLNNFISAMRLATGTFFRWVGDDDWLEPNSVSRALEAFEADARLILVTSQISYVDPDGLSPDRGIRRHRAGFGRSGHPFLRDAAAAQRELPSDGSSIRHVPARAVVGIERRNMLREDEVFATKLALAGPWAHVPEVLARRNWGHERLSVIAGRLEMPSWHAHFATTLQCREMLGWLDKCDLDDQQRSRARSAVLRMYVRRQRRVAVRRGRKLLSIARGLVS